jgi:NTE family protein
MGDYRIGRVLKPALPLARAVAASSAFPPVLSPCEIKVADYKLKFEPPAEGEDLNKPPYTTKLVLSDGGVYDNLGLETAFKRYKTLLVSDGGGHLQGEADPHQDWARHAFRVLNVIDSQVRALRTRQLITLFNAGERKGGYWSMRQHYPAGGALACPPARTDELATLPTRLKKMSDEIQERLINWGYAITDATLRTRYDQTLPATARFPYPAVGV